MKYLIGLFIMLFSFTACQQKASEGQEHHDANHKHEHSGHSHHHDHAKAEEGECSHCGMMTEHFKKWNAFIENGKDNYTFCSTRCMLATKLENKENLAKDARFKVTDYYTLKVIDADSAFYIMGSDVAGPMGKDFIVVDSPQASADFIKDHGGQNPVMLEDIDMKMLMEAVQ